MTKTLVHNYISFSLWGGGVVGCGQWYNRENGDTRQFLMGTQATRTRLGGQTRVHQIYFQIYNSIAMKQKPDVLHFRSTKCAESGNVATSRLALSLWKKTQEKPLGPGYQLAWTVKQITASNTRNWGVGHSPISPKRPCTTEQGRVLWLLSLKRGMHRL